MEEILFNHLGVKDGLSSNEITCILKDQKGFMWFGTTSGLNRFDGYEFSRYKPGDIDSFFVEEGISDLVETADGKIWITYYDGKIGVYEPSIDCFVPQEEVLDSLRLESLPARIFRIVINDCIIRPTIMVFIDMTHRREKSVSICLIRQRAVYVA